LSLFIYGRINADKFTAHFIFLCANVLKIEHL